MFAFAIWDTRRRQMLLARDRLGIKPLYYSERNGELLFASELKPILQLASVERSLDWESVGHLFTFLATPSTQSIVEGVAKLEPARFAVASQGRNTARRAVLGRRFHAERARDRGRARRASCASCSPRRSALHQVSDVPVGAFLSGGIDSSAVVATMARPTDVELKTFSIGFAEASYDELPYARQVAAQFGTDHYELVLRPDVVQIVEDLTWYLDEPFGDTSAIPTYMVSKLAAEHVKVVLTGDGGDELFAGYDKYVVEGRERRRERIPAGSARPRARSARMMPDGMTRPALPAPPRARGPERYLDASTMFHADEMRRLFRPEALAQIARARSVVRVALADWREPAGDWLAGGTIRRPQPLPAARHPDQGRSDDDGAFDRGAAAAARSQARGVRGDDPRALPPAGTATTKYLFKQAMRGILPDAIIDRPKHGFAVPLAHWFRGELAGFARDVLLSGTCRERGIFDARYVERLFQLHARGRDLDLQLWTMLSFELWCRRFLDTTDVRDVAPERTRQTLRRPAGARRDSAHRGCPFSGRFFPPSNRTRTPTEKRALGRVNCFSLCARI